MKKWIFLYLCVPILIIAATDSVLAFGIGPVGTFYAGAITDGTLPSQHIAGGGGIVIDTNLAYNRVFNYRLETTVEGVASEYYYKKPFPIIIASTPYNMYNTEWHGMSTVAFSTVHYFGFGVVRNKHIRFWLGPQISTIGLLTDITGFYIGIGFALGLNINIGNYFTIAITGSGRFLGGFLTFSHTDPYYLYYNADSSTLYFYPFGRTKTYTPGGYGGDGLITIAFMFRVNKDVY